MTAVTPPALVDRSGNIALHARGGCVLAVNFQDATGASKDVTGSTIYFEIDGVVRVQMTAGGDNGQKLATLTRAHVQAVGVNGRAKFAVIDETATPVVLWSGEVRVDGYAAQPA